MLGWAIFLFGSFVVADRLARYLDDWVTPEYKEWLRGFLSAPVSRLEKQTAVELVQAPLRFVARFLDDFFGPRLLSSRALKRGLRVSGGLIVLLLGLAGYSKGVPFALETPPWKAVSANIDWGEKLLHLRKQREERQPVGPPTEGELEADTLEAAIDRRIERLVDVYEWLDTPLRRVIYGLALSAIVLLETALFGALSVLVTRRIVREILTTPHLTLIIGGLLLNTALGLLVGTLTFATVLFTTVPIMMASMYSIVAVIVSLSAPWGLGIGAGILVIAALFDATDWVKLLALTSAVPSLLLLTGGIIALLLYPVRRPVRGTALALLRRAAMNDTAFRALVTAACVTVIGAIKVLLLTLGY